MKTILVCALDWGLGHASRTVPVVRELLDQGAKVILGSSGSALKLLRLEFPDLECIELPGYSPVYPVRSPIVFKLLPQLPRFVMTVRAEHAEVERLVRQKKVDMVISDNRYGCWSREVKSIFVTHQVNVMMPEGYRWFSPWINGVCQRHIRNFSETWIPDQPGSGLTDPFMSASIGKQKMVGWLSRFRGPNGREPGDLLLAIISGPEPQRRIFHGLTLTQLKASGRRAMLVSGEPGAPYRYQDGNIDVVNHLKAAELEEAIHAASLVISRSGYSTVMDLIATGKNAIFVPTPQQPEQKFLARHLLEKGIAYSEEQEDFSLSRALAKAPHFRGLSAFVREQGLLEKEIRNLMA